MQNKPFTPSTSIYKDSPRVYLFWDESYFWGVLLWRALKYLKIPFATCRSEDIKQGLLQTDQARILIAPGGFASAKANSLGDKGCKAICEFVKNKGFYLGFCGGAGLALNNSPRPGLELCSWKRKPASTRLPNCSGHIKVHPACSTKYFPRALQPPVSVPVWWPSQFQAENNDNIYTLAKYQEPDTDFWVGDIPLACTDKQSVQAWENIYDINLDPELLLEEPSIISGDYGQGGYLLSYLHLETPHSPAANLWLFHILSRLEDKVANACPTDNGPIESCTIPQWDLKNISVLWDDPNLQEAVGLVQNLIRIGEENFLFCWRKPWLLGWRRGIPGFALNSLLAMLSLALEITPGEQALNYWNAQKDYFLNMLKEFHSLYQGYLIQKRLHLARETGNSHREPTADLKNIKKQLVGSTEQTDLLLNRLFKILQELIWIQISSKDSFDLSQLNTL